MLGIIKEKQIVKQRITERAPISRKMLGEQNETSKVNTNRTINTLRTH